MLPYVAYMDPIGHGDTPPVAILGSHLGVHLEAAGKAAAGHRFQLQLRGAEHL